MNPTRIFYYFALILISYFVVDLGKILSQTVKEKMTSPRGVQGQKNYGGSLDCFWRRVDA